MQEAGYILIMPGGDWNADTTYHILHLVNHNGASWLCKVEGCTGQEPSDSNTEFWQRFGTAVDLSNIDAKTLDGNEADYFAPLEYFANRPVESSTFSTESDVDKYYEDIHNNALNGSFYEGRCWHNVSHSILGGGQFYVFGVRFDEKYGWQKIISYDAKTPREYERSIVNGVWTEWTKPFTTAGGQIKGPLYLWANAESAVRIYGDDNSRSRIKYFGQNEVAFGGLGFHGANKPCFIQTDGTEKDLLHTGNKPTGTYTGNGDATVRNIETGALNPLYVVVEVGTGNFCIVATSGYVGKKGSSVVTGSEIYASGSKIVTNSTNVFNVSGTNYKYYSL